MKGIYGKNLRILKKESNEDVSSREDLVERKQDPVAAGDVAQ